MGCLALELAGHWVELDLRVETQIAGRALADWYYVGPGGLWLTNVLNSALPPQRLRPDTRPEHQDLSATQLYGEQELDGERSWAAVDRERVVSSSEWGRPISVPKYFNSQFCILAHIPHYEHPFLTPYLGVGRDLRSSQRLYLSFRWKLSLVPCGPVCEAAWMSSVTWHLPFPEWVTPNWLHWLHPGGLTDPMCSALPTSSRPLPQPTYAFLNSIRIMVMYVIKSKHKYNCYIIDLNRNISLYYHSQSLLLV